MKKIFFFSLCVAITLSLATARGQTAFTLNPLTSFGRSDGSIQPGDSIGTSPTTGNNIQISAQTIITTTTTNTYGVQPGDSIAAPNSTNGFNMRGLSYDPVSGNLVFVDSHTGSGGASAVPPNAAIYVLDSSSGQIIGALNTNGITGGSLAAFVTAGVADDGVVYVANQVNRNSSNFKIYRWPTANTNDARFNMAPTVAYNSAALTVSERLALNMDVRGAGTNTQIIVGSADASKTSTSSAGPGTNIFLFTTADGTNFTGHRLYVPGLTNAVFNDGIAFGPTNTFFTKEVGAPLYYLSYDPATITNDVASTNTCTVIATFTASSANDPLLNLSAIAVDNVNHLFAGLEEIGGTANGGRGRVWLYDFPNPTNKAPAILASRTYIPNFVKAIAPMGYLDFGGGRLYANVVNNGLLASTVDSIPLLAPTFVQDLPSSTRIAVGQTAHFEVIAITDVTNYQWFSNNVAIAGATTYYIDVPNVQTNLSGTVYKVVASNPAGTITSSNSTLRVVSVADFFHLNSLWSIAANTSSDATNYITSNGGANPKEKTIAYNSLSNQLLVVRGVVNTLPTVFVINPDNGAILYTLKTNGISGGNSLTLAGIGVADDGAVYAANAATDNSFRVYRWADTGSNTIPQIIYGTNSSAGLANPIADFTGGQTFRFGDTLAVRGSGLNTEIILDSGNTAKYVAILHPTDTTMTNWSSTPYLLQNIQGSYGSEAYGVTVGRSLQFGIGNTFWQKRYNAAAGAPLAEMSYTTGGGLSPLVLANVGLPLFTNGPAGINFSLNVIATVNFVGGITADSTTSQDTLDYYDFTDPAQAVLLSKQNLPGGTLTGLHKGNTPAVAQVVFAFNPLSNTNYVFVINGNNGISAFVLAGGITPPPKILAQPKNLRILEGSSGALGVSIDQLATIQWFKGTNSPVDTGVRGNSYPIPNAQSSAAGDYFAIATNINGSITSLVAHVSIGLSNNVYTLTQAWAAPAGNTNYPYVTSDGGANTPNERSFAYNSRSNQLVVVRCPPGSTAYTVWVVDAATGANLYTLNTTGVIHEGPSEVPGANPIDLVAAGVADDGAIYICSESPNASGGAAGNTTKMMHVFRWADSGSNTAPTLVYQGDPSGQPAGLNLRWGDVMAARGSGTNTELVLNSFEGNFGAVLKPTDTTVTNFTNSFFADAAGGGSIGRSIQFGTNNTVYEKRRGAPLYYSVYNVTNQTTSLLFGTDFSATLGGGAVDTAHALFAGVDFVGNATSRPDTVTLYDISDPTTPMLISQYPFPSNQVANANSICQTVVVSNRVYSLDANNGLVAFNIVPPVGAPLVLTISRAGSTVTLSWTDSSAVLQGTPSLTPTIVWTDITTVGQTTAVESAASGNKFYRLIKR